MEEENQNCQGLVKGKLVPTLFASSTSVIFDKG